MNFKLIISVALAMANFLLLFNRKTSWFKSQYKCYLVITLFIIGILLILIKPPKGLFVSILFSSLMTPAIYSIVDFGFERLSFLLHDRDFYLWLKGSSELNTKSGQFKASDKVISLILLYIVIALPIIPLLLIKVLKILF